MSLFDLCRLCSSKSNLLWVFNRENTECQKMEEVIFVTTGVEIHKMDMISQKICDKCTEFIITMFSFRKKCIENDKQLKDMCMQLLKTNDMRIPNTDVTIKHEKSAIKDTPKQERAKSGRKVHPTIANLFKTHPKLKLPSPCLSYNVSPFVSMPLDEVENYFKSHSLNFKEHTKLVLKSEKADRKESTNFGCGNGPARFNFAVDAKIISNEKVDDDNGVIRPIKIKIFSKDCASKEIGSNCNASLKNLNTATVRRKSTSNVYERPPSMNHLNASEYKRLPRKRKFSDVGESPNEENDKESPSSLSYINKSIPLDVCDIYNSVEYNAKDLIEYQNIHLHCQFCKMKFDHLERKLFHLKYMCIIKNAIENLPDVEVQKVEHNMYIRRKYPEAFNDFPALDIGKSSNSISINSSRTDLKHSQRHITAEDTADIIDISSDDDDDVIPIGAEIRMSNTVPEKIASNQTESQIVATSISGVVYNNVGAPTVEITRPKIIIKNNSVLNGMNHDMSDTEVLKQLLVNKSLKLFAKKCTQTYLPTNKSINVYSHGMCAEFKDLKRSLHTYKIPVVIKRGPFSVSYNYSMDSKKPKKLHLWNDLQPIDIKAKRRNFSIHHSVIQMDNRNSNIPNANSNNHIPIAKPLSIKSSIVNTPLQSIGRSNPLVDDVTEGENSSTSKPQTIIKTLNSAKACPNSFLSNVIVLQQDVNQYSSISIPQTIITTPSPVESSTNSFVSNILPQQDTQSFYSTSKRQAITSPSSVSTCSSSSVPNICASPQGVHQYPLIPKPQEATTTFFPAFPDTNSSAAHISVSQQGAYGYSSTCVPPRVTTVPIPVSNCSNSPVANISVLEQGARHSSISKPQDITTAPTAVSACTSSSVANISVSQQGNRYSSTYKPQEITTAPIQIHTSSSVVNTCVSQQGTYTHSSASKPEEITIEYILASTRTSSSVSNTSVSHLEVYQYSSKPQEMTTASTCTSSSVSSVSVLQQDAHQYSSTSKHQENATAPIAVSTCTISSASNISVSHQDVHQYPSISKPQEMTTVSVPTCTISPIAKVSVCQQVDQYSSTSKPQEVITTAILPSTCPNSSALNVSDPHQDVHQYSLISKPQEIITAPTIVSSCGSLSASNISESQQGAYQYSSTFKLQEDITTPIAVSTCTSSSVTHIFGPQQGDYHSSTLNPQQSTAAGILASNCSSSSVANISVSQQSAYSYSSTSKPQEVITTANPPSSVAYIPGPQQDVFQHSSTSKSQEVTIAPVTGVSPQGFIKLKDMSELI